MLAFEEHRLALRQVEPLGPLQHDVWRDDVQDSLVMLLADLAQATVAGQDLGPDHRWRPRQRRGEWQIAITRADVKVGWAGQAQAAPTASRLQPLPQDEVLTSWESEPWRTVRQPATHGRWRS